MNLYTKTLYKVHGSNASWEWLEIISPCVVQLCKLVSQMHDTYGSAQGNKHAPPNLSYDIGCLIDSMREFSIYTPDPRGRAIEGPKASIANVLTVSAHQLIGPLADYNELFERLRRRRRLYPVVGERPAIYSHAPEYNVHACAGRTAEIVPGVSLQTAHGSVPVPAAGSHSGGQELSQYDDDDKLDRASVTSRRSSTQGDVLEPPTPSATFHDSDASLSSDGASEGEQADVEDSERLPWEQILDEPLERLFTLDTEENVDVYMY
ncbi:hypothetical protein PsYK624_171440 [Phanerochaete sordida]|uniref:DUF6589 domain-containing protein n=1 Tax=Phanerochaete sordida TaxID=48140 RepID=A0A9P3LMS3_9APHY|nr:hypothetical protein PsYK624_171440 [Phanerochaete sordida]